MATYPFKNLVFKGGGILGIAYLGSLKVLDLPENNILSGITRVSGASAGAITALATSICTSADEIRKLANSLDFSKVPSKGGDTKEGVLKKEFEKIVGGIEGDFECILRLLRQYGWYSSEYFYNWLKTVIQGQFDKNQTVSNDLKSKGGMQTFADFKAAGFRDLYVSVTNVSQHINEIFSNETQPNMPVADAVRMSMSIPLYFESIEYNGNRYSDGGVVNNYPMQVFDESKYAAAASNYEEGVNWETLGCYLFKPDTCKKTSTPVNSLIHYIENTFLTLLEVQDVTFNNTPNLKERSAMIDNQCISPVDFDIASDDDDPFRTPLPEAPYDKLYRAGYTAMETYLKNYTPLA